MIGSYKRIPTDPKAIVKRLNDPGRIWIVLGGRGKTTFALRLNLFQHAEHPKLFGAPPDLKFVLFAFCGLAVPPGQIHKPGRINPRIS